MRKDGKTKFQLMLMALFFGLFGGEYFYVKKTKMAWTKLLITWLGATIIILMLILWASLGIEAKAESLALEAHANKLANESTKLQLPNGKADPGWAEALKEAKKVALVAQESIDAGKAAFKVAQDNFYLAVVIVCSLAAILPGFTLVWSLLNVVQIQSGSFRDEHNKEVSSWKSTKEEFAKYLLGEE